MLYCQQKDSHPNKSLPTHRWLLHQIDTRVADVISRDSHVYVCRWRVLGQATDPLNVGQSVGVNPLRVLVWTSCAVTSVPLCVAGRQLYFTVALLVYMDIAESIWFIRIGLSLFVNRGFRLMCVTLLVKWVRRKMACR